ncbi:NAD(P)H dehydrogenase (quinone) [Raphanus sativus]|nr:NAD(P)H dehydrogenase (quinone) [Raphanus sativus]
MQGVIGEQFHLTSICDSDNDCGCINIDEGVPVIRMEYKLSQVLQFSWSSLKRPGDCKNSLRRRIYETWSGPGGVEAKLWQVPETLSEEALSKMSTPAKSESPIITPNELTEADGFVFGFPTRYGMMAAQFKVFLDATGGLWRTQSLAGKPAGSSTALALKLLRNHELISNIADTVVNDISSPLKDQSTHVYIICDGENIEGFAIKMTEPQPKYSTSEKQVLDML